MFWPNAYRLPKWILSATAAAMLAAPTVTEGQVGPSAATGKPTIQTVSRTTKSSSRSAAAAVPPAEELPAPTATVAQGTVTDGDSPVQKELRRLYQESGREAPAVPTPEQMQSINGRNPAGPQVAPYGSYGAAPPRGVPAPAPSGPVRSTSRNPVVSFFQKLVPGRDSKPVNQAPAPATTHPAVPQPPNHALVRQAPPPARSYTPYGGAQPQRLPEQPARPTAVATAPATTPKAARPVPPRPGESAAAPVNVAQKLQLDQDVVEVPQAGVRAEIIAAPQPAQPVITGPKLTESFTSRQAPEGEPVFESPVMVDATEESPFETPIEAELGPEAPMEAARTEVATTDNPQEDFPDPFSQKDEANADAEVMESPFSGLALDEEEPVVAKTIPAEAAPQADATPDTFPLTLPPAAAPAAPAPATAAIEPEGVAKVVPQPAGTASTEGEDTEFFPADGAQPAPGRQPSDEPVLALPNDPIVAKPIAPEAADAAEYAAKMQKIKDRGGMKGLKGFCPVTLRDERELKDARPDFHSQFRGQKFHFASAEAKAKFDQSPAAYAPASYGADVVVLIRDKDVAEGTLDFAAWFKGQLYLFSSEETHAVFTDDPAKFAAPMGIE